MGIIRTEVSRRNQAVTSLACSAGPVFSFCGLRWAQTSCPPHVRIRASLRRVHRLTAVKKGTAGAYARRLAALCIDGTHARPQRGMADRHEGTLMRRGETMLERGSSSEGITWSDGTSMLVTIMPHRASGVSLPVTISASVWPQKFQTALYRGDRGSEARHPQQPWRSP